MISALKTTFSLKNLKILRLKVTKILRICLKKFCEFPPRSVLPSFLKIVTSYKNDQSCLGVRSITVFSFLSFVSSQRSSFFRSFNFLNFSRLRIRVWPILIGVKTGETFISLNRGTNSLSPNSISTQNSSTNIQFHFDLG